MPEVADIIAQHWDAIIVGTGIGGATLGYALAKAGKRVLFCEKGRSYLGNAEALTGRYAELFFAQPSLPRPEHREILAWAGRCWDPIEDHSASRPHRFIPFIGNGTGGSSALYGMAMERFFPEDFTPRRHYPDRDETSLPERWPISYQDLVPYYAAAEQLYRVRGGGDPLRTEDTVYPLPAAPLTFAAQELTEFLRGKGFHPYRLPMACESVPGCECCLGYLCPRDCKNDSARICLQPALAQYGAALLDQCEVTRLEATREVVTGVVCERQGEELVLRSDCVVLAAGALVTPAILLRSRSTLWPNGLANDSGLVGRNLMRHFLDLYLIAPRCGASGNQYKEIAFNDFYRSPERQGTVQSFGLLPPAEVLAESLEQDIRNGFLPQLVKPFRWIKPVLKPMLRRMVKRSWVLAGILEDLPYPENRVTVEDDRSLIQLHYRIRPDDQVRIERFRNRVRQALRPYKIQIVKLAENNERLAHACGTCRFGEDARESVLDPCNRAHGLGNLYVVDSSFFPSSGGTNPSLTIAANALRVGTILLQS